MSPKTKKAIAAVLDAVEKMQVEAGILQAEMQDIADTVQERYDGLSQKILDSERGQALAEDVETASEASVQMDELAATFDAVVAALVEACGRK